MPQRRDLLAMEIKYLVEGWWDSDLLGLGLFMNHQSSPIFLVDAVKNILPPSSPDQFMLSFFSNAFICLLILINYSVDVKINALPFNPWYFLFSTSTVLLTWLFSNRCLRALNVVKREYLHLRSKLETMLQVIGAFFLSFHFSGTQS